MRDFRPQKNRPLEDLFGGIATRAIPFEVYISRVSDADRFF